MYGPRPSPLGTHVRSGADFFYDSAGNLVYSFTGLLHTFGNAVTNPNWSFVGSGTATFGNVTIIGTATLNGSVVLATALPIAQGGTAATTAAAARTSLGLGALATLNTAAAANVSGGVLRQGTLGSGVVTVQSGGAPSGGSDGDVYLIY